MNYSTSCTCSSGMARHPVSSSYCSLSCKLTFFIACTQCYKRQLLCHLITGSVVAVTSSLHKPASLHITTGASSDCPQWVPLTFEGSWPYDKAVEEALPNITHQVLQVSTCLHAQKFKLICKGASSSLVTQRYARPCVQCMCTCWSTLQLVQVHSIVLDCLYLCKLRAHY